MKKIRWKLWFGIVGVYFAGLLTGVIALVLLVAVVESKAKAARANPEISQEMITDFLTRKLELTQEQREEVNIVIGELVDDWQPIREQAREDLSKSLNRHSPRIREILETEEQQQKLTRFLEKVEGDWNLALKAERTRAPDDAESP